MKILLSTDAPSRYFTAEEFKCNCNGRHGERCSGWPSIGGPNFGIDPSLVDILETIRKQTKAPLSLNCGYRCKLHNAYVGGSANSFHLYGAAADVVSWSLSPKAIFNLIEALFHPRELGVYNSFVHVAVGPITGKVNRKTSPHGDWEEIKTT